MSQYTAFNVELVDKIAHVQINRPEKINSMNAAFWSEIVEIFQWIDDTDECEWWSSVAPASIFLGHRPDDAGGRGQ
jgi:hypothetical protein